MTLDTACSGALIGLDLATRYLQTREISSAIVAGANLYCSPEHVMDHYMGANGAASLSGKCHTFDAKADGYIKAEAVSMVYLKRLDDAIRDEDPIRAIIRGTATNSDGWTAGIASPNSDAQAAAIKQAYRNAGISDLSQTGYVEFHGTGTRAGDSIEADGVASVFAQYRTPEDPLRIGSVKSNIGHSEPAAGLSGLLKTILSLEKGIIPGNPTFVDPSPKIDFERLRIRSSRTSTPWPVVPFRRASVNSFGYGGSNAHVVLDEAKELGHNHVSSYLQEEDEDLFVNESARRPYLLAFSANDEKSLESQFVAMDRHLSDPAVSVKLRDLAYTLGERRSWHYHRGFVISTSTDLDKQSFVTGHIHERTPKIGFIFTGQGAQWPQMGKGLLETFPIAARTIDYLDQVLKSLDEAPSWTLYDELVSTRSAEHLRLPEMSQPLVTAFQLAILAVLDASGVSCHATVGHSSGEITAAVAAGYLTPEQAIKIAYYRGKVASEVTNVTPVGMMAAGLSPEAVDPYLGGTSIEIACINSPQAVTLSGNKLELIEVERRLKEDEHFARLLLVDAAYHSRHMAPVASKYQDHLERNIHWPNVSGCGQKGKFMVSSTTGKTVCETLGPAYWVKNMVSPVLFSQAVHSIITEKTIGVDYLLEIGPSNALSGPVNQIKKAASSSIPYSSAWKRGPEAVETILESAGKLYNMGCPMTLSSFNEDSELKAPSFISDLPNYSWNHSIKYWHETESSIDWRYRKFIHHDLLGSKILGTPWSRPIWKNVLKVSEVTWLRDHLLGDSIICPAAAYVVMAIEAIYQKSKATGEISKETAVDQVAYKLRNVTFPRMLTLDTNTGTKIWLSLEPCSHSNESWHKFNISSVAKDDSNIHVEHCYGLVSIDHQVKYAPTDAEMGPLRYAVPGSVWYKAMRDVGYHFGPTFQPCLLVESKADSRRCRALIKLDVPESRYPQSRYSMHPAAIDGSLQIATVALNRGLHSAIKTLMPPALIDDLVIFPRPNATRGIVASEAVWSGVGRSEDTKRYVSDIRTVVEGSNDPLLHLQGLRYHAISASMDKPHAFTQVVWAKDVDFLTPDQMANVLKGVSGKDDKDKTLARIATLVSLIAHKRPSSRLLEAALDDEPSASRSIWIDDLRKRSSPIAEGCAYRLSTASQEAGLKAREKYSTESNIEYVVHDVQDPFGSQDVVEGGSDKFDALMLRISHVTTALKRVLESARKVLRSKGYLILLQDFNMVSEHGLFVLVASQLVMLIRD